MIKRDESDNDVRMEELISKKVWTYTAPHKKFMDI
jgi:hypothetical protein